MRTFRILVALGGILLVAGIYLVFPASSVTGSQVASIPVGPYYYHIEFNAFKAGRLSGTFSVAGAGSITLYVFSEAQSNAYQSSQATDNLFTTSGSSGSFSASIVSPGNYFLVVQHTAASSNQAQNIQVSWVLDGSNPIVLGTGFAVLAAGFIMIFVGYRKAREAQPPPSATDVVMFDRPKTEAPPDQNPMTHHV